MQTLGATCAGFTAGELIRRGNMKFRKFIAVGLCGLFGSAGAATAADAIYPGADTVEYKTPSGWTFNVALYGWLAGLKGNVGAAARRRMSTRASATYWITSTSR